jgi:hypothetical protein
VVHIAPGQIQTFTPSAHASIKAFVHSGVMTFPLINTGSFQKVCLNSFIDSIILFWNQCAVSSTKIFIHISKSGLIFSTQFIHIATAKFKFPFLSRVGAYISCLIQSFLVKIHTNLPSSFMIGNEEIPLSSIKS